MLMMLNKLKSIVITYDDDIAMAALEGAEIPVEEIKKAIRKATIAGKMFPCIPGSAYKNKGVQYVLDAVRDYLPSPIEVPNPVAHDANGADVIINEDPKAPFVALAFKLTTDQFGTLCFFRVYSGTVKSGSYVYNATKGQKERVSRLELVNADSHENITEAKAGEIAAAVGFQATRTGDTLVGENDPRVTLEAIKFQEPVISEAIEPVKKGDQDKMSATLIKFTEEDPTFHYYTDSETSTLNVKLVLHKSLIVKLLEALLIVKVNISNNQAVMVNMVTLSSRWNQILAKVSKSPIKSLVVQFQKNLLNLQSMV